MSEDLNTAVIKAMRVDRFSNVSQAAIDHMVEAAQEWLDAQVQPDDDLFKTLSNAVNNFASRHKYEPVYIGPVGEYHRPLISTLWHAVTLHEARRDCDSHKPTPDSNLPYGIRPDGPETGPDPDGIAERLAAQGVTLSPPSLEGEWPTPTLRDRFAMAAMMSVRPVFDSNENGVIQSAPKEVARYCYQYANAMMAERERSQPHGD